MSENVIGFSANLEASTEVEEVGEKPQLVLSGNLVLRARGLVGMVRWHIPQHRYCAMSVERQRG